MKHLTALALFLATTTVGVAQYEGPTSSRIRSGLDVGAGFNRNVVSPSLSYYQLLNVTRSRAFSIGWTATFRTFYASNLDYITAPAELSRGKTGFAALGAPYQANQLDTLRMASASNTSFNFGVRAQVRVGIVEIGASADVLGITLGRTRTGRYLSENGFFFRGQTPVGADTLRTIFRGEYAEQSARPSRANIQLLGDNSYGTLAAEVFARVQVSQRLAVKAGYQWLATEYIVGTVNRLDNNDRFRNRSGLTYIALTFPFF